MNGHKLVIPTSTGISILELDSIIRFESDNNYTNVYIAGRKKPILISKTLMHFERALRNTFFIRIHQSHLVNARKIINFETDGYSKVRMENNDEITVSRSRKNAIKSYLLENNYSVVTMVTGEDKRVSV